MRKPEQRLWDYLRRWLAPAVLLERVENIWGNGTPDVFGMANGISRWMELKACEELPSRGSSMVLGKSAGLNVDQVNWHVNAAAHGCTHLIVVGLGSGARRELAVITSDRAREVNTMTLDQMRASFILSPNVLIERYYE